MLGLEPRSYVLFVGTVEPRKGIDVLLAAHAALRRQGHPDLRLVVAGPPGWGETPTLDGPGVVAPGRIDEATLDALYRGAAALAVPVPLRGLRPPGPRGHGPGLPGGRLRRRRPARGGRRRRRSSSRPVTPTPWPAPSTGS